MSATTDTMIAAVTQLEADLQALAATYETYTTALATAQQASARVGAVDSAVGTHKLHRLIAGRLVALGLRGVLQTAHTIGPAPADWDTTFNATLTNVVP